MSDRGPVPHSVNETRDLEPEPTTGEKPPGRGVARFDAKARSGTSTPARSGRGFGALLTLRMRVLVLVFLINALIFGAGGVFAFRLRVEENEHSIGDHTKELLYTFRTAIIREESDVHVGHILRWPHWPTLEDAIVVGISRSEARELATRADIRPAGVVLNPLGREHRRPDFDLDAALAGILTAVADDRAVNAIAGGRVEPIEGPNGTWGALWYRTKGVDRSDLVFEFLPWFLLSTLLLTGGSFFALRQLVLRPVEQLAAGARSVRAGDFSVRLKPPDRTDELAELVRSFNAMTSTVQGFNDRLAEEVARALDQARKAEAAAMTQRRLAAMGELAAGIAHEINNPLGGLQNAVETLRREDLSAAKRAQYLDLLQRGLVRIGETVHRLRRFTPRAAENEVLDLVHVTQDAIDLVRHRARRLSVVVEWEPPTEAVRVRGARNEIGQAVLNLLSNALDSLEEGGTESPPLRMTVLVEQLADGARLIVSDNGLGVEPERLHRVADLFYTTKEVGKGTGLGLALVHRTMAALGGRVELSSRLGESFTVELDFPDVGARPEGQEPTAGGPAS